MQNDARSNRALCLGVFCLLVVVDMAGDRGTTLSPTIDLTDLRSIRNILHYAINRIVVGAAETMGINVGTFVLLWGAGILVGAMALILFARLTKRHFGGCNFCSSSLFALLEMISFRRTGPKRSTRCS